MSADYTPEYIKEALKFGINLGLERMEKLNSLLGNPKKDLKVIHIAGTNGKGSTSAFISSILAASGKKVGLYTSPYLERFSERMRIIDAREGLERSVADETYGEISSEDLKRISDLVKTASEDMVREGYEHPTEFELVTAICYVWFHEQNIDIAVLETGLGGRLDSTNVFDKPLCSVITAIGMDHCDRLGDTIDKIAGEKAGIIKSGCPVVISDPDEMILDPISADKVRDVLDRTAREKGSALKYVKAGDIPPVYTADARMRFRIDGDDNEYITALCGRHQIRNAALAIETVRTLGDISEDDIAYGISMSRWKGRAECLSLNPVVLMDGGHNYQGAQSLVSVLSEILNGKLKGKPIRVVMGVMKDKDIDGMLGAFKNGNIIMGDVKAVRVSNPRTMTPSELCEKIKLLYNSKVKVSCLEDAKEAVREAYYESLNDGMPLLVTGSLYLIGEVRGALKECTITSSLQ